MSISAAQLVADVSVTGVASAVGDLLRTGLAADTAGEAMKALATGGLLLAGAAIVGIATKSVQMAGDYEQSMNKVMALTGSSKAQMAQYDTGLKQLAITAGVTPTKLADGLYNVISANYAGADAMKILTLATEDAKIGMTSAATTTNSLTTLMRAFALPVKDATLVNGEMITTVTLGKMTMEQYANAIGKAAITSKQFHVSMETMNASIATLTANGIPSASQAVTDYNQALSVMDGNIGAVAKSLNKNGIAFDETKFNAMSFTEKIAYMNKVLQEAAEKHVHITGVTKQAALAIQVLSDHSQQYNQNLATLSDRQKMAQATQAAWAITQDGFNQTLDRLKAAFDVVLITIGSKLLPILTNLGQMVLPLIQGFSDWIGNTDKLGGAIGGLGNIFAPISTIFQQFGSAALTTIKPAFAEISSIVGGVFAQHMKTAQGIVADLSKWFSSTLLPAVHQAMPGFQALASVLISTVVPGLVKLWAIGQSVVDAVLPPLMHVIEAIIPVAVKLAGIIDAGLAAALKFLMPYILQAAQAIGQFAGEIATRIAPIIVNFFNQISKGLDAFQKIWAMVWPYLAPILKGIWDEIVGIIKIAWSLVSGIIKIGLDLLSGNWSQAWTDVKAMVSGVWDGIKTVIQGGIELITGDIKAFVASIVGFFQWLWDTLTGHSIIPDMVKSIISWFSNLFTGAVGWIQTLVYTIKTRITEFAMAVIATVDAWVKQIIQWFVNLHDQAVQKAQDVVSGITGVFTGLLNLATGWGKDLISNFLDGIKNAAGGIGNVMQSVGNTIKSFIHFSKPDIGPLADFDTYAPDMMELFATGIESHIGRIKQAIGNVASAIHIGVQSPTVAPPVLPSYQFPAMQQNPVAQLQQLLASGQGTPVILQIDGRQFGRVVMPSVINTTRLATGVRSF